MYNTSICVVAILKDENRFLDEWLVYHRMIGIDHFFLYDDDPTQPLLDFLMPHKDYVSVINWWDQTYENKHRKGNQLTAYNHAVQNFISPFEWVTFIDGDEFIVLKHHTTINDFLCDFKHEVSVSLNWHAFGHNGFYNDPIGFITSSLNQRRINPMSETKTISKTAAISSINTAHYALLKYGERVDANHKPFTEELYKGKSDIANINHYSCRSFKTWMRRIKRGDVNYVADVHTFAKWRFEEQQCLERFVSIIARDNNKYEDNFMLQFRYQILERINKLNRNQTPIISKQLDVQQFSYIRELLELIVQLLISNAEDLNNIGLLNGKTGVAFFLFYYGKFAGSDRYKELAHQTFDSITDEITEDSPIEYNNGIAGFGIAMEYLTADSLIKINTDEILEDIDVLINYYIKKNEQPDDDLYENIIDLGKYYIARLSNPVNYPYTYRELKNKALLHDITELIYSRSNSYYQILTGLDFLCMSYVHSINREKVLLEIRQQIVNLKEIIRDDLIFEKFDPLYAAEILLKFSSKAEDEFYYNLAIEIIDDYENAYWAHVKQKLADNKMTETGLRYLHLAKLLKNTNYINKGLSCLMPLINSANVKNTDSIKNIIGYGLILLLVLGEWSDHLFDTSLRFTI